MAVAIVTTTPTLFRFTHEKTGGLGELYTFSQAEILAALPAGPLRSLFARTGLTDDQIKTLLLYGPNTRVSVIQLPPVSALTIAVLEIGDDGAGNPCVTTAINGTGSVKTLSSIEFRHSFIR